MEQQRRRANRGNKQIPMARPMASAIAFAMLGTAGAAGAQQAADNQVESVVVTANKRAQNLQDVPAAITVLNDAALQRANVRELDDLPALSPALTISFSTQPGNFSLNMRGIGTYSLGIGVESDVSVVIDDIPVGMQAEAFKDLADVFRIEVLKGPQSTLFGKSSIAGALNITTKPIGGPLKGATSMLYTSDGEWRAGASISGAVSDKVRMRLSASKSDFPGIVDNLATGGKLNGSKSETIAAKLEWRPTEELDITFSPQYNKSDKNCCVSPLIGMTAGGLYQNTAELPASTLLAGINAAPGNLSVRNDYRAGGNSQNAGAGLKVNYAFDEGSALAGHTLTSITSRSSYKLHDYQDGDATAVDILQYLKVNGATTGLSGGLYQYGKFGVDSTTQELRLTSPDTGRFRYVAGLWYGKNDLSRELVRAPVSTYVTAYGARAWNTSYALFGQSSFDFTPQTSLITGLRLNKEDTGYNFTRYTPPPAAMVATEYYSQEDSNHDLTGRIGLEHKLNADAMAYGMFSTGHKGVAYDLTSSFSAALAKLQPVPAERAKNYELGLKTSLLDNRATLNLALFKTNFKGFQQSAGFFDPDGVFRTTLHSIGELQTRGAEAEGSFKASRQLLLNASVAYTQATIVEFENGPCYYVLNASGTGTTMGPGCTVSAKYGNTAVQNLAGKTLPNAPKIKLNLGGQYDLPLDRPSFNAFFTGAYRWQSETQYSLNQDPLTIQGAFGIFNFGAGIKDKQDRYKFSLFVNNVFNKQYAAGLASTLANGTWSSKSPNPVAVVNTLQWTPPRDVERYFGARLDLNF
jgi:iron complex outermembrane receptor protein